MAKKKDDKKKEIERQQEIINDFLEKHKDLINDDFLEMIDIVVNKEKSIEKEIQKIEMLSMSIPQIDNSVAFFDKLFLRCWEATYNLGLIVKFYYVDESELTGDRASYYVSDEELIKFDVEMLKKPIKRTMVFAHEIGHFLSEMDGNGLAEFNAEVYGLNFLLSLCDDEELREWGDYIRLLFISSEDFKDKYEEYRAHTDEHLNKLPS